MQNNGFNKGFKEFLDRFKFQKERVGLIGVERECFITKNGNIAPIAETVLRNLPNHDGRFGYELSACQLESRVGPISVRELSNALLENEKEIIAAQQSIGFNRLFDEVAPEDMPLDVYPDPTGRYQTITAAMSRDVLLAACRVIGTHIHVGMQDHAMALEVYNKVICHWEQLCFLGDGSSGRRIEIYKKMAPEFEPSPYSGWEVFYEEALRKNFATDPRRCWHLIRISTHGTIEFRMFGATDDLSKIVGWANKCLDLCFD